MTIRKMKFSEKFLDEFPMICFNITLMTLNEFKLSGFYQRGYFTVNFRHEHRTTRFSSFRISRIPEN